MNNLLLLEPNGGAFRPGEVKEILLSIKGTYNLREGEFIGAVMDCEYDVGPFSTIIRLSDDLKSIELTGVNNASLSAALEIQRLASRSLRLLDLAYSFDVVLRGDLTLDELRRLV